MTDIKIFENEEFGSVKTIEIDCEIFFIAKEVAFLLGYGDGNRHSKAIANAIADHVDEYDKKMLNYKQCKELFGEYQNGDPNFKINSNGMMVINESGLYSLILSSKLPKAKEFKRWITSEVIPSIRKTGGYIAGQEELTESELMAKALSVASKVLEERERRIAQQAEQLEQQKPLVEFAEHVSQSVNSMDLGTFAKLLNDEDIHIGRNKLFKWMKVNGYLMDDNVPYQQYIDARYFDLIEQTYNTPYGTKKVATKTLLTGKGQIYFTEKLRKEFANKK